MKYSPEQIEQQLRQAPCPSAPPGLRQRLIQQIGLNARRATGGAGGGAPAAPSWLGRWWPALAGGGLAAITLAVVGFQQAQLARLQVELEDLRRSSTPVGGSPGLEVIEVAPAQTRTAPEGAQAELERLRTAERELLERVASLEALRGENEWLRAQAVGATSEQMAAMAQAREQARSIACINNLKQLGLAARIWATDNGDTLPPDIVSMKGEMGTPKILTCPADVGREAASSWEGFSLGNVSYEFLAPSEGVFEANRVAFRCPIHGHVGLVDGSVQQVGLAAQDRFQTRDGKLYLGEPPAPASPRGAGKMDERMMLRYGLTPPGANAEPRQKPPPQ